MKSEKTVSEVTDKKGKRLRFAGLVLLTVLVIAAALLTVFIAKSCDEKVQLDMGQSYDAGKAVLTVTGLEIKRVGTTQQVYVIVTVKTEAKKDFTFNPYDFSIDDVSPMFLRYTDDNGGKSEINTDETVVAAGETAEIKIAFMVPRSMKESFLTYKKAVIRLGSMIENDNNLS